MAPADGFGRVWVRVSTTGHTSYGTVVFEAVVRSLSPVGEQRKWILEFECARPRISIAEVRGGLARGEGPARAAHRIKSLIDDELEAAFPRTDKHATEIKAEDVY